MKNYHLFIGILIFFSIGCSKNSNIENDCIDTKLEELEMVKYDGEEIGCQLFLELFHYKNKQYFLLGSHCADIDTAPIDCDGNIINDWTKFYNSAESIGIIGIGI